MISRETACAIARLYAGIEQITRVLLAIDKAAKAGEESGSSVKMLIRTYDGNRAEFDLPIDATRLLIEAKTEEYLAEISRLSDKVMGIKEPADHV